MTTFFIAPLNWKIIGTVVPVFGEAFKGDQIELVQYRSINGGVVEKVADVAIMKM